MKPLPLRALAVVLGTALLAACGGGSTQDPAAAGPSKVALSGGDGDRLGESDDDRDDDRNGNRKARCRGDNDRPETALQGQVPIAMRLAPGGFKGFSCNLELIGVDKATEGGNWSSATYQDRHGRSCLYHSTATPGAATRAGMVRQRPGVPVIDISDRSEPKYVQSLTTPAMMDAWESLRVHQRRKILIGDNAGDGGSAGGPEVDIYDLSRDCRKPQLITSTKVGTGTDGGIQPPGGNTGHEGNISPDGLTYWIGDIGRGRYNAVDVSNLSKPKMIASWAVSSLGLNAGGGAVLIHGLSLSNDGNRAYATVLGFPAAADVANPAIKTNGFAVLDTSEVQQRKPNAQIKTISTALYKDGSVAQHTIPVKIGGKRYVVMVDEAGSGGLSNTANAQLACDLGLLAFPVARLFDVSDETHPKEAAKITLEMHKTEHCSKVIPDIAGLNIFTYGSHYCSVDNRDNATALACGYFNSGIRVFDIRNVKKIREIAYFNPASTTAKPGSNHATFGQWRAGGPDWCASRLDFDFKRRQLITMCQDTGAMVLKFARGTWPFEDSTPSVNQN
jgi:LVIVD repeat